LRNHPAVATPTIVDANSVVEEVEEQEDPPSWQQSQLSQLTVGTATGPNEAGTKKRSRQRFSYAGKSFKADREMYLIEPNI
jgi:hypothetical protein